MINDDFFITFVVMFLVSIVAILVLLITFIFVAVNSSKQKKFVISPVQICCTIISLIILYLGIPFVFLSIAERKQADEAEKFYKLAVNISIIPSVKSEMLQNLGSYYYSVKNGEDAIEAYEHSIKIKENKPAISQLCNLYTIKEDYDNAISVCQKLNFKQIIAINYVLKEEYNRAYSVIDEKIQTGENITYWDYAIRAYINRKLNKKDLFERDYQKSLESCPNNERLKKLYENEDYYKDLYSQYKKEYNL